MAELQVSEREALKKHAAALPKNNTYRLALRYADAALKEELESYAKPTEESDQQEKKGNKKLLPVAAAAIVVIAIAGALIAGNVKKNRAYESAQALLSAGEYSQAIEAFSALDGYKDAESCRAEAEAALTEQQNTEAYASAQELLKDGKFDEAIAAFTALGDYSDSVTQVTAAKQQKQETEQEAENRAAYEAAERLLTVGNYDAAIEAFTALGDYADASDRAAEAEAAKQAAEEEAANKEAYAAAEKLLGEKKYADAKAAFEALGEYSDAKEKAEECQKQLDAQWAASATATASGSTADTTTAQESSLDRFIREYNSGYYSRKGNLD